MAVALIALLPASAAGSTEIAVAPGVYLEKASAAGISEPRSFERESRRASAPRIVGGVPTSIDQMPWQVAVAYSPLIAPGNGFDRQSCGGTLVAPTLVVTAAHCVAADAGALAYLKSDFSVISGRTHLSSGDGQESVLADYYFFTDGSGAQLYDPDSGAWDVAILELAQASSAGPIKIAGPDERELWSLGRSAFVSGWGQASENGPRSDQLLSAEIAVFRDKPCAQTYLDRFDLPTSFCAGTALGTNDSCYGDSGGPVVVPIAGGGFRLVGNTQFGLVCGSPYSPGVYGRLATDPIQSALRNAALNITGQDIIGSGAKPPTVLTPAQARENAWIYVEDDCNRRRRCRAYGAKRCSVSGLGFRCSVSETAKKRRIGKLRCRRKVFVSAASGSIERRGLRKWKCG